MKSCDAEQGKSTNGKPKDGKPKEMRNLILELTVVTLVVLFIIAGMFCWNLQKTRSTELELVCSIKNGRGLELDNVSVDWYKNGKFLLTGKSKLTVVATSPPATYRCQVEGRKVLGREILA